MDNSPNPIGPGFKKTDLKAGMKISFPYQNQVYKGTIDGFNIIEGRELIYVDGIAYRYSEMELKPTYTILTPELSRVAKLVIKPVIKSKKNIGKLLEEKKKSNKAKRIAGFKLMAKLTKKK